MVSFILEFYKLNSYKLALLFQFNSGLCKINSLKQPWVHLRITYDFEFVLYQLNIINVFFWFRISRVHQRLTRNLVWKKRRKKRRNSRVWVLLAHSSIWMAQFIFVRIIFHYFYYYFFFISFLIFSQSSTTDLWRRRGVREPTGRLDQFNHRADGIIPADRYNTRINHPCWLLWGWGGRRRQFY